MKTPGQEIPVLIVCFNNHLYVENTIRQLKKFNLNLHIMDNASTNPKTIEYLKNATVPVFWNKTNEGPWVNIYRNVPVYEQMPQKFILTDPDLEFNPNLPLNFVDIMIDLSIEYETHKLGLALDISDFDKMYQSSSYSDGRNIYNTEIGGWAWRVDIGESASKYEMYFTGIDTTFHLIDKIGYHSTVRSIRIAGDFMARHIPWYRENSVLNKYEEYMSYKGTEHISTMSRIIVPEIESKYLQVKKGDEIFLLEKDVEWKDEEIDMIDKSLHMETFIQKSGCIGTVLYASRKYKKVIFIVDDSVDVTCIRDNCRNVEILSLASTLCI